MPLIRHAQREALARRRSIQGRKGSFGRERPQWVGKGRWELCSADITPCPYLAFFEARRSGFTICSTTSRLYLIFHESLTVRESLVLTPFPRR